MKIFQQKYKYNRTLQKSFLSKVNTWLEEKIDFRHFFQQDKKIIGKNGNLALQVPPP